MAERHQQYTNNVYALHELFRPTYISHVISGLVGNGRNYFEIKIFCVIMQSEQKQLLIRYSNSYVTNYSYVSSMQ